MFRVLFASLAAWICAVASGHAQAEEFFIHTFDRQQLTGEYYSEGNGAGDLNRDGNVDIVYGPYWFAGPKFTEKHEIYPPKPQNREGYANHFFAWVYDFNGDGWNDVLTAGFPGTPAFVYENPRAEGHGKHWPKHQVFNQVGNESPQFTNIVGEEGPKSSARGMASTATPRSSPTGPSRSGPSARSPRRSPPSRSVTGSAWVT